MRRTISLKLTLAYDGSAYVGWQRQENGVSIQQRLEEKLEQICGRRIVTEGASRTDARVHALGMVVSCRWPIRGLPPPVLRKALNALLPEDIRILRIQQEKQNFHARFNAKSKLYRYYILNTKIADPFRRATTWFIPHFLDILAMQKAARYFVGKHNFSSVAVNPGYERSSMVRHLYHCRVWRCDDEIRIEVKADGFLYKMVRTMVGTLVEVGLGKRSAKSIATLLEARDRRLAGMTAPPQGLFLVRVNYGR